jgi:microcompartment protein CcmL/EutN
MSQRSLGLIETFGLLPAVEAADAAVKSANVDLVGYEFAKGSGMTVVKVEGDVGAVKAAIAAAYVAASKVGRVAATRVIPRPAAGLEGLTRNGDTKGYTPPEPPAPTTPDESGPEPDPDRGGVETTEQEVPASEPVEVTTQDPTPAPAVVEEVLPEPVPAEEVQAAPAEPVVEVVSEPEPAPAEEVQPAQAEPEVVPVPEPEAAPAEEAAPAPAVAEVEVVSEPEPPKVEAKKTKSKAQGKKKRG